MSGFLFATAGSKSVIGTDTVTSSITGSTNVNVDPAGVSLATSTFGAAPTSVLANGSSTSTITLQLKDALGNDLLTGDGATYVFNTDRGSVGSATDNGDGTISATLTSSTSAGPANVSATRNGSPFSNSVSVTFTPGPAVSLEISAPASATAGTAFAVTVTARDAFNNVATGYLGTVAFSGGGSGAQLPANYSFVGGDAGAKSFASVELRQAGSRTITVTDTVTGSITGNDTLTVNPAAGATLEVAAPAAATAGSTFSVDVTARDTYNNVATGYLGTVAFSGGGSGAQLPANYSFVGGDAGTKTFNSVELRQAGSRTITVTDTVTGSITGSNTLIVNPAPAATLEVAAPAAATAGSTFSVDVTARDTYNNVATGYLGTVAFSGGGSGAQLPVNYTFVGGDAGVKTYIGVELRQAGSRTITATDTVTGSITGNDTLTVNPAPAATLEVAAPAAATAGSTFSVDVTAHDAFNNVATGYTGTVTFSGGGTGAQLPADYSFVGGDAGTKTFNSVELRQAGSRTITATDTVTGTITGNDTLTVNPAAAATLEVAAPAAATAGSTFSIDVTARDTYNNVATGYLGTVAFSGGGTGAQLPADYSFVGGDAGGHSFANVELRQAGSRTVTATDTVTGTVTGNDTITVNPGAATQIILAESGSTTAGDTHLLTATLKDAHGNTITSDNTTVVSFAKTSGAGTVTGLGDATAGAGVATKSVTNRLAGQIDLDAQAAGLTTGTMSYTIVVGPVSASASTVNAVPSSVVNNGTDATTITVTVLDAGGNPLSGKNVTLDDAGASSMISTVTNPTDASGQAVFTATDTVIENVTYSAVADAVSITDTAMVNFVFNDNTPPTNTITLSGANGASLTGTTLYYRPAAAGSFTLSSAVVDGGSGPASATYPAAGQVGWTHALETVNTPAGGPYVSNAFSWTNATSGDFDIDVEAADAWTPPNSSTTTLNVTEDSTPPAGHTVTVTGGPVFNALMIPFVLGDGSDGGSGLNTASRSVTRQVAALTSGVCGSFSDDAFSVSSPDTGVMSGNCYRYVFTIADRVGNVSATATSAVVQVDSDAPVPPTQVVNESSADGHASGSTLYYLPSGSGTFTVTASASDAQSGIDKVTFPAVGSGFVRSGSADDATAPHARDYTWSAGATATGAQTVTAHDLGTNSSNGSFTLTADSTAPTTSFTAPAAGAMLDSNVHAITASATDPGGAGVASVLFEVSDGGPFAPIGSADTTAPYSVGWDTSSVSDGPKTLRATTTDNVGNTTVVTRNVAVDKVVGPPNTSITVEPINPENDTTPEFEFTATETPATFECNIDGAGWASCATPFTVSPALGEGSHTLRGAGDRCRRQHRSDRGERHVGHRCDPPDRLADRPGGGRAGRRQRRHRQLQLSRRALGRTGRALRGLARCSWYVDGNRRRRHLAAVLGDVGYDARGRRRLRPPRRDDRHRRQLVRLGLDHGHRRQHRPEPHG